MNFTDTHFQTQESHSRCSLVQVKSVQLIADGKAPRVPQTEEGATYEGIQKKSNAKVRVQMSGDVKMLWNFII